MWTKSTQEKNKFHLTCLNARECSSFKLCFYAAFFDQKKNILFLFFFVMYFLCCLCRVREKNGSNERRKKIFLIIFFKQWSWSSCIYLWYSSSPYFLKFWFFFFLSFLDLYVHSLYFYIHEYFSHFTYLNNCMYLWAKWNNNKKFTSYIFTYHYFFSLFHSVPHLWSALWSRKNFNALTSLFWWWISIVYSLRTLKYDFLFFLQLIFTRMGEYFLAYYFYFLLFYVKHKIATKKSLPLDFILKLYKIIAFTILKIIFTIYT